MNILYIKPYEGEVEELRARLPEATVRAANDITECTPEELQTFEYLSVFVDYPVTAAVLEQLPAVRCIATRSAGYDHIDMSVAAARGVAVCRVPHYGTRTVAEYAFALMFALSRNAYRAYTDMQRDATVHAFEQYEGFDLCGKTLGVVGTGAIGRSVCEIARGIGMCVVAYDVSPDAAWAESLGIQYQSLEAVLGEADIVTLHVPSIPATHHLINTERIALMKPGSYLINTARGEIVDTAALVAALERGHLAGAGLDVLEGEHELREEARLLTGVVAHDTLWKTLVADHALIDMPNVIVTPHIAFNTKEAKQEITEITVANIAAFSAGTPQNLVTS